MAFPMFKFLLLLALSAGGLAYAADADAQSVSCTSSSPCSQGAAYSECVAAMPAAIAIQPNLRRNPQCHLIDVNTFQKAYRVQFDYRFSENHAWTYQSHGGTSHYFLVAQSCSSRPPLGPNFIRGSTEACYNGCSYEQSSPGGVDVCLGVGPQMYCSGSSWSPTGSICSAGDGSGEIVAEDDCQQLGTLTQCVQPDGKHCARASNGVKVCWSPGEAGVKQSGNVAATKSPEAASINAPANQPPNGGNWSQAGAGSMSESKSGNVTNYNITTWQSTYGVEGGSGGEGEESGSGPSASGGADCSMSVQCSDMSSAECNTLVQVWYLRCKGVDLSGGSTCDDPPVCTGDAGTCHISTTLWRMRCDGHGAGDGDSDGVGKGLEEIVSGEGDGTEEPDISGVSEGEFPEVDGLWVEKQGNDLMGELDASGFLSDRSCPSLPSFSVAGSSFSFDLGPMCSLAHSLGVLVLALAYWIGFRIIAGAH